MIAANTRFNKARSQRHQLSLAFKAQQICIFIEGVVRQEKSSLVCCSSSKSQNKISQMFAKSFKKISKQDQMEYYIFLIDYASNHKHKLQIEDEITVFEGYYRKDGRFKNSWEKSRIQVTRDQYKITVLANQKIITINLRNFLIRKSNSTQKSAFVLMSIHDEQELRLGFLDWSTFNKCYNLLFELIKMSHADTLFSQVAIKSSQKNSFSKTPERKSSVEILSQRIRPSPLNIRTTFKTNQKHSQKLIIQQLLDKNIIPINQIQTQNNLFIKYSQNPSSLSQFSVIAQKQNLDIFHKILPEYTLQKLESINDFQLIRFTQNYKIFQHNIKTNKFKLIFIMHLPKHKTLPLISNTLNYPLYNQQVQTSDLKIKILSQNAGIYYQQHKQYSQYCNKRDYLYLRHMFNIKSKTYMIDKSIDTRNYPPFAKIVRGEIVYSLWMIDELQNNSILHLELQMNHEINKLQNQKLTIRYLEGITKLINLKSNYQSDTVLNTKWDINKNQRNFKNNVRIKKISDDESLSVENSIFQSNICEQIQQFFTIDEGYQQMNEQISVDEIEVDIKEFDTPIKVRRTNWQVKINTQTGKTIISEDYLKKRTVMSIVNNQNYKLRTYEQVWVDWNVEDTGVVKFINIQKNQNLTKVYKYLVSSIGNQLIKANNYKLPVDVYGNESFLTKIAKSFGLAIQLFEQGVKNQKQQKKPYLKSIKTNFDSSQLLKRFTILGFSSCLMLAVEILDMSFEPIIGQTYQGWLSGHPIYCQQVSDSQSRFLLIGKQYKLYGRIGYQINLSFNKHVWKMSGQYTIDFNNGQKMFFYLPNIQVSGITFTDKLLNFSNKCIAIYPKENLFCEIVFLQDKISFSKQNISSFNDTIKGGLYKISQTSMKQIRQFIKYNKQFSSTKFINSPAETLFSVKGRWTSHICFNSIQYFSVKQDLFILIEQQKNPLPSDSKYRQDIIYKISNESVKSQIQKQKKQYEQQLLIKCKN